MNYYLLEADLKANEVPKVVDWYQRIDVRNMEPENYHQLPEVTMMFAQMAPNTHFQEIIVSPFLLLPKEVEKLLKIFEPWMSHKDVVLISKNKDVNHKYVFPLLQRYDCLSEKSVLNRDKTVIEKGILIAEKIPDHVLFMLKHFYRICRLCYS